MKALVVVMGVSGCGKTTIGEALAAREGLTFADGDDFHSEANKAKMHAGTPLTDADRAPWLAAQAAWLRGQHHAGGVLASSALRRAYRDRLREGNPGLFFVHLHGTRELLLERVNNRQGHFMPPTLLDSQLETLEALEPDEAGATIEIGPGPQEIVAEAAAAVARHVTSG